MKLQDGMLVTKVTNVKEEEEKGGGSKQELDLILHDEQDFAIYSDSFAGFVRTKTDLARGSDEIDGFSGHSMKKPEKLGMSREIANNLGQINNEIFHLNKTMIELTQAIQGQNDKILTLEREMQERNDCKSPEEELKNAIQVKKDGIK